MGLISEFFLCNNKKMVLESACAEHCRHLKEVAVGTGASKALIISSTPPSYSAVCTYMSLNDAYGLKSLPSNIFDAVYIDNLGTNALWKSEARATATFSQIYRVLKEGGRLSGLYASGRHILSTMMAGADQNWSGREPPAFGGRAGDSPYLVFDSVLSTVAERAGFKIALLDRGAKALPTEGPKGVTAFGLLKSFTAHLGE